MRYNFITGLPRSGSTLLASILRQNPRFNASIMTPLGHVFTSTLSALGPDNEASMFLSAVERADMLRGLFDGYYSHFEPEIEVVFDNNRRWTANISAISALYPVCKVLCCVRSPKAIVDSFERLFQAYPLHMSMIYGGKANTTAYERVHEIMKPTAVLGYSLNALRTAFFGPENRRMLMVEYDDLCRFPEAVIRDIYTALGEEQFIHDFNKIEPIPGAHEFDLELHTPGLHALKPTVVYEERKTILPPDIFAALPTPFWRLNEPATPAG